MHSTVDLLPDDMLQQTKDPDHVETTFSYLEKTTEKIEEEIVEDDITAKPLFYGVTENPPIHVSIVCAFQQSLLSLYGQLVVSLLVAEAVCASDNNIYKARLLSSTLFMDGITTICMNLFGIRLPLFQGASAGYIIPLLLVSNAEGSFCSSLVDDADPTIETANITAQSVEESEERIISNIRAMQGSLMLAGFIHFLLGFTGLIGVMLRFVGPFTIVPSIVLALPILVRATLKYVVVNWAIAFSTITVACILCLYLSNHSMPLPVWTPSGGCRVVRTQLHQMFAILISILINWGLCGILTATGILTDDPNSIGYEARTDARVDIIRDNSWFTFPYPGQYGTFGFSGQALVAFLIATLQSILDSIGDYYACAKVSWVPPPPAHAMNRGIVIEGLCTMLSGAVGAGHATSTYGGNIGAVGVTKVASRQVFLFVGIFYTLFGIFGKFSAVFITIPYPVLGGAIVVMFGILFGVVISNLEVTQMSSPRNIAIFGLSVFIGLMVPLWAEKVKTPVQTGNEDVDKTLSMLIGNPVMVGTALAFFLDNTAAGTREERGIAAWHVGDKEEMTSADRAKFVGGGYDVYNPLVPERLLQMPIMKYIPFLPFRKKSKDIHTA